MGCENIELLADRFIASSVNASPMDSAGTQAILTEVNRCNALESGDQYFTEFSTLVGRRLIQNPNISEQGRQRISSLLSTSPNQIVYQVLDPTMRSTSNVRVVRPEPRINFGIFGINYTEGNGLSFDRSDVIENSILIAALVIGVVFPTIGNIAAIWAIGSCIFEGGIDVYRGINTLTHAQNEEDRISGFANIGLGLGAIVLGIGPLRLVNRRFASMSRLPAINRFIRSTPRMLLLGLLKLTKII